MVSVAIREICDMVDHARLRLDDIGPVATVPLTNLQLIQQEAEEADESELLWTTNELKHYANEAIREVAIRTRCLRDGARNIAGLTNYPVLAGNNRITIDPRIMVIKRVWWNDTVLAADSEQYLDENYADYNRTAWWSVHNSVTPDWRVEPIDSPTRFVLERSSRSLMTVGVPTVNGTIKLDVIRLPLTILEAGVPEIPQQMLSDCLDWMCYLAYLKNDADTYDPNRAGEYAKQFESKVGPRPHNHQLTLEYHQAGRRRPRLYNY